MTNIYYTASGNPGTGTEGLSSVIRTEFQLIQSAFDLIPQISTTGLYSTVFAQQGNYTFTLPSSAGTLAKLTDVTSAVATETAVRTAAVTAETTRATAAEATKAPLAGATFTGNIYAPLVIATAAGSGYAVLAAADSTAADPTHTGSVQFYNAAGTRQGYIGYSVASGMLNLESEGTATGYYMNGALTVDGTVGGAGFTALLSSYATNTALTTGLATKQNTLGFTAVQQGTGVGQNTGNNVKIGWSGTYLKATVDSTDLGNVAFQTWVSAAYAPLAGVSGNWSVGTSLFVTGASSFTGLAGFANISVNTASTGSPLAAFYYASTAVGTISTNGSVTAYNTTSDYRLKVTFGPWLDGAAFDAVPVHNARFIAEGVGASPRAMFLAHELQDAGFGFAVTGERDAIDGDGAIVPQVVDYSMLVPALWAMVKDLRARVVMLEAR